MSFWLDVWLNVIQFYSCHWVKPCCRKMIYDDDFNYFLNPYVEGKSKQNSQNNWLTWAWFLLNKFLCSLPEILNFCFFSVTWQIFRRNIVRLEWSWENWLLYVYVFSGQRQAGGQSTPCALKKLAPAWMEPGSKRCSSHCYSKQCTTEKWWFYPRKLEAHSKIQHGWKQNCCLSVQGHSK